MSGSFLLAGGLRLGDNDLLERRLAVPGARDLADQIAPADALAEADVAAQPRGAAVALHGVEVQRGHLRDEELRPVRVRPGVGVGELAGLVEEVLPRLELVRDRVAGPAHSLSEGIAPLDHEARDHAVEDGPVVERLLRLLAGAR